MTEKANTNFHEDIEAVAKHFSDAVKMKNAAACAHLYSETAIKLGPVGHTLIGRSSIQADFQHLLDTGGLDGMSVKVEDCRAERSIGFAILRITTVHDQFIVMLGLEAKDQGEWLITHELISSSI